MPPSLSNSSAAPTPPARHRRPPHLTRLAVWVAALLLIAGTLWLLFAPRPIIVEVAAISQGRMEVTVDQQGEVRVHDRYTVAAPVSGRLRRIELHEGDEVRADALVAELEIAPVDPRTRQETLARLTAARALVQEAEQRVAQADAELDQANREVRRMDRLVAESFVSKDAAEKVRTTQRTAQAALLAAQSRAKAARSDEQAVASALLAPLADTSHASQRMQLRAPATAKVLRVIEKSERTVPAGTPLVLLGDATRFEIVADVLSTDAVKIRPGMAAYIEQWGGQGVLRARVRTVEPYAFTKVSSLGIEEKRVNVVFDPLDGLGPLGDGYRVETRTVIWSGEDALRIPSSALFRTGDEWAAFFVENRRASRRIVQLGERNAREAQLLGGGSAGERVVNYPPNELADGRRVNYAETPTTAVPRNR